MSTTSWQDQLLMAVRVMQVIIFSLATGCLTFAVIVVVLHLQNDPAAALKGPPIITYVALAALLPILIALFTVRGVLEGQARRSALAIAEDEKSTSGTTSSIEDRLQSSKVKRALLQSCQSRLIVSAALLEGMAFFLLVAYFIEGNPLALGGALALVVGIILQFPTRSSVAGWLERQVSSIRNEQQFS